jgi:hypothetical protein
MQPKAALAAALRAETSPMATGMAVVQGGAQEVLLVPRAVLKGEKVPDEISCPVAPVAAHFHLGLAVQVHQVFLREEHPPMPIKMVNPEQATEQAVVVAQEARMTANKAKALPVVVALSGSNGVKLKNLTHIRRW